MLVAAPGMLSERIATLDLSAVPNGILNRVIAEEAARLADGLRAAVWTYQEALDRMFLEQDGMDLRWVTVDPAEAAAALTSAVWSPHVDGLCQHLVQASFGVAGSALAPTLALALPGASGDRALVLVELPPASEPAVAALEPFAAQAAAALTNHAALARVRRHESEREALYQTAGELSSDLELQRILEAIVGRARGLVSAPISYIMLIDEARGEIYMRAVSGVTSPSFRDIRLAVGTGLGGAVSAQLRPFYTSDYLNDGRFRHRSSVDEEVRAAGIRSILGVPMRVSSQFVGVLYVADRVVRVYPHADVDILVSLAQHAAVAIKNAALYERATAALAEASAMNSTVEEHNRRLRRADDAYRQLSEAMLAGHGLAEIVELTAALAGTPVAVLDARRRPLASAGAPGDPLGAKLAAGGVAPVGLIADELAALAMPEATVATVTLAPRPPRRIWGHLVVPVLAGAEVLGSVWASAPAQEIAGQRSLLEQATRVIALELLRQRSIAEAEGQRHSELLDELLSGRAATLAALHGHAADFGVDLARPHRLAVASVRSRDGDPQSPPTRRAREALVRALRRESVCAFAAEHGGRVVALLASQADPGETDLRRPAAAAEQDGAAVRIVVSSPCAEAADYRATFAVADRTLALLGDALAEPVLELDRLRVLALLFRDGGVEEVRAFVQSCLGDLLARDAEHRGELIGTLEAYLEAGASPARTAKALHVHVNTVYYRLERLRELLGPRFAQPRRALDLQVALLAHRLLL